MRGIVYKSTGSWYYVKAEDGLFYECRLKGKFRIRVIKSTNPLAVGDRVVFSLEKKSGRTTGVITELLERENYLIRRSVNLSKQTHILAANIDCLFLVITLKDPITFTSFIDRFLVTAEAYDITTTLIFNKTDIYSNDELEELDYLMDLYETIGYRCLKVSVKEKIHLDLLQKMMMGKVSIFAGHSGVGKSSLINALAPELQLKTQKISQQHKQGQHTTTFAEMFDLEFGAQIIDTPGIRGFGVVNMEKEEIADYFPEFFALKSDCKYNNCLHVNEPGCAVKDALEQNKLGWSRYRSYLQLLESDDTYRNSGIWETED